MISRLSESSDSLFPGERRLISLQYSEMLSISLAFIAFCPTYFARRLVMRNRGGSRIFFRRGCTRLLLYFNTNKPHSFFFCRVPVVLENCRSSRGGGGGAHPLHPPPRSASAKPPRNIHAACEVTSSRFQK